MKERWLTDPNYYVFVATDAHKRMLTKPSAYEIAMHRLSIEKWGINEHTRNKKQLKPGDRIIAYAAGRREYGGNFLGIAELRSETKTTTAKIRSDVSDPKGEMHILSTFYVQLHNSVVFPNKVLIEELRQELAFIQRVKNAKKWGSALQGGVVRISEKDFELIMVKSGLKQW